MNPSKWVDVAAPGWSLTETLVAVSISALLMSWAWPQWTVARQTQHRQQAQMQLHRIAQDMAWAQLVNGQRPTQLNASQLVVTGVPYRFEVRPHALSLDPNGFVLWAHPLADQWRDPCGSLWLDHTGQTGLANAQRSVAACWGRAP